MIEGRRMAQAVTDYRVFSREWGNDWSLRTVVSSEKSSTAHLLSKMRKTTAATPETNAAYCSKGDEGKST